MFLGGSSYSICQPNTASSMLCALINTKGNNEWLPLKCTYFCPEYSTDAKVEILFKDYSNKCVICSAFLTATVIEKDAIKESCWEKKEV